MVFQTYLDHPRRVLGCVCLCAKFSCNQCSSFYNMKVWIFGTFGLKKPIRVPKLGYLGNLTPQMGCNINKTLKCHTLAHVFVIWAIKHENLLRSTSSCQITPHRCNSKGIGPQKLKTIPVAYQLHNFSKIYRVCTSFQFVLAVKIGWICSRGYRVVGGGLNFRGYVSPEVSAPPSGKSMH